MRYQIRFIEGELEGKVFPIGANALSIGRSRSTEVKLSTPDVSARHVNLSLGPDGVIMENLSSRMTNIDGEAMAMGDRKPLVAGQTVGLGTVVKFMLEALPDAEPGEAPAAPAQQDGDKTAPPPAAESPPPPAAAPTQQDDDKTKPPPAPPPPPAAAPTQQDDDKTVPPPPAPTPPPPPPPPPPAAASSSAKKPSPKPLPVLDHSGDSGNETIAMETRMASPEELEYLRGSHERRKIRRVGGWIFAAAFLAAVLAGVYFFFFHRPPEKYVSWPVDESGEELAKVVQMDDCPYQNDLDIKYPDVPGATVDKAPGKITVRTALGKYYDVPLRLILEYFQDKKSLITGRTASLEAWMADKTTGSENWNFDLIQPVAFYQHAHGIPYLCVPYSRTEDNESYVGYAVQMRMADWTFILMKEIPTRDRWRAEWFIQEVSFFRFSKRFLMEHWEGTDDFPTGQPAAIVAEAKALLRRRSPTVWYKSEYLLRGALCQAQGTEDKQSVAAALELLNELRTSQIEYFNQQKITYLLAKNNRNKAEMKKISVDMRAVFSSEEDFRFYKIRQDKWD
ncbi:MAG: hypothetical protein GX574_15460 [Lentisphaerae bacterium]|nr:hypothetical protein [Lentisphaerota bacterium]